METESGDAFRQYLWLLPIVLGLALLGARSIQRRRRAERSQMPSANQRNAEPAVGPEGFARARKQFLLTLALLVVIVAVSILTHLQ